MEYRRAFIPGGSYFLTQVTYARRPLFGDPAAVTVLRDAFHHVRSKRSFEIDAIVILPDHLHCIWTMPPRDADYSTRWRLIKTLFTKHCDSALRAASPDAARLRKGEQALWQHRFWEHCLRDWDDFQRHVDYIHFNPVKHGYVTCAGDWRHSSFRRYLKLGLVSGDWGCRDMSFDGVGHE